MFAAGTLFYFNNFAFKNGAIPKPKFLLVLKNINNLKFTIMVFYLFGWVILSFFVAVIGSERNIGYWGAFFLSLFLSPLIGFIFVAFSANKNDEDFKVQLLQTQYDLQKMQEKSLEVLNNTPPLQTSMPNQPTLAAELEALFKLLEQKIITEEDFVKAKEKLLTKD